MTQKEFENIYHLYFNAIRNYVYYRSGNQELATDIAQESFVQLWEKNFDAHDGVKSLLYKMAGDNYISYMRREKLAANYAEEFRLVWNNNEEEDESVKQQQNVCKRYFKI